MAVAQTADAVIYNGQQTWRYTPIYRQPWQTDHHRLSVYIEPIGDALLKPQIIISAKQALQLCLPSQLSKRHQSTQPVKPALSAQCLPTALLSTAHQLTLLHHYQHTWLYLVKVASAEQAVVIAQQLQSLPYIDVAQPDILFVNQQNSQTRLAVNQPIYNAHLYPLAQRLSLAEFWQASQGKPATTIAVLDSGFDLNHPLLRHIPVKYSWDIDIDIPGAALDYTQPPSVHWHGSSVAGVIWAQPNLAVASGGINNTKQTKNGIVTDSSHHHALAVRLATENAAEKVTEKATEQAQAGAASAGMAQAAIISQFGQGHALGLSPRSPAVLLKTTEVWTSQILQALIKAEQQGAQVISISWLLPYMVKPVADYARYLTSQANQGLGINLVVADAHLKPKNQGWERLPQALVVTAHDHAQQLVSYYWHQHTDIAAVGYILSASSQANRLHDTFLTVSASVPVVAGLVALSRGICPKLTAQQIEVLIKQSASKPKLFAARHKHNQNQAAQYQADQLGRIVNPAQLLSSLQQQCQPES